MKQLLKYLFYFLLLTYFFPLNGQIENVKFKNYGINDGLSYSLVTGIVKDNKGFLWVSTQNGLNKYDGYEFRHYFAGASDKTILKNHISHLFKDSYGKIWIHYFKEGIGMYDPEYDRFKIFTPAPDKPGSFPFRYLFRDDVTIINQNVFCEDNDKDIWIASENGLAFYDRKNNYFKAIQKDNTPSSLSSNYITSIICDKKGYIWIGTKNGLNRIEKATGTVTRVFTSLNIPELKTTPVVSRIKILEDGTLWLGTINMGLFIIENPYGDVSSLKFTQYNDQFLTDKSELTIFKIYQTKTGKILMASSAGLFNIKYENKKIDIEKTVRLTNGITSFIVEDDNGFVWAGGATSLLNNLIYRFDKTLQQKTVYGNKNKAFNNFRGEPISLITKTDDGLIMVGTIKGGFYIIDTNAKKFGLINSNTREGAFLTSNNVYSIYEDPVSNLWIGTSKNLFVTNLKTGYYRNFNNYQISRDNISYNYSKQPEARLIGAITKDNDDRLWLGSFDYKLSIYDPKTDMFINFHNNPDDPRSFTGWSIRTICNTRTGDIYIGGTSMGLCKANRKNLTFTYYTTNDKNGPSDMWINSIIEDKEGYLWLGTFEGLDRFDPKTGKFTFFSLISDTLYHTKVNVRTIFEPEIKETSFLWVGTDKGLIMFDKQTGSVKHFTEKDGLPNNTILGILEDDKGFLWLSSLNGITKFDPVSFRAVNFNKEDGLQSNEFNEGAFFKNSKGVMYFGGINGITYFNPDEIDEGLTSGKVLISELRINQNTVLANDTLNGRIILTKDIAYTKELNLTHNDKLLSFIFTTSNLTSPNDIIYRYKLTGYEEEWNTVPANQRIAKYSDLKSGSYTLLVDSKFSSGSWSGKPTTLVINVAPYIWETAWFKTASIILLLLLAGLYLQWRTYNLKKQKKVLENEVKKRTEELNKANKSLEEKNQKILEMSKKTHEMDMMKLRFFTNISHEFRTPLTLILNPTEKLLNSLDNAGHEVLEENLKVINRNAKRLYKLINQLLELPKIDSGTLKLLVSDDDIVKYISDILNLFKKYADSRNIKLLFNSDFKNLNVLFDKDKIEKILYNLLSNAIDYTPEGGEITISLSQKDDMLCIGVKDSGKGIPENKLNHIFERFYQTEQSSSSTRMSTGIGLSLVKSLVKTYRGDIKVFSKINEGTEFLVFLPYKKESFKEDEVQRSPNEPASFNYSRSMLAFTEQQTLKQPAKKSTGSKTKSKEVSIVIVEDNIELNNYLFNELKEEYNVYTAFNGKEGLNLVQKHLPNIVISDVMMPEMDGIELCNTLKADINTSHIPVFLLTAKSEETHHLEGLNVGADDYITKPFSIDILKLRIANAIKNRKLIIEKFSVGGNSIPDGINISPIDQDLLQKIVTYVENNIDNDITSDKLAAELGLSKSNLYKKLKDLTGFSVNIYIRNIRLNIAAQLLKKENYSISDVAYAVGFNNPKYFSSCFMKYFGKSPRDFMLSQKAENDSGSKSDDNRTTPAPEK